MNHFNTDFGGKSNILLPVPDFVRKDEGEKMKEFDLSSSFNRVLKLFNSNDLNFESFTLKFYYNCMKYHECNDCILDKGIVSNISLLKHLISKYSYDRTRVSILLDTLNYQINNMMPTRENECNIPDVEELDFSNAFNEQVLTKNTPNDKHNGQWKKSKHRYDDYESEDSEDDIIKPEEIKVIGERLSEKEANVKKKKFDNLITNNESPTDRVIRILEFQKNIIVEESFIYHLSNYLVNYINKISEVVKGAKPIIIEAVDQLSAGFLGLELGKSLFKIIKEYRDSIESVI